MIIINNSGLKKDKISLKFLKLKNKKNGIIKYVKKNINPSWAKAIKIIAKIKK